MRGEERKSSHFGYGGFESFAEGTGYLREALDFGATNQICILVYVPQESCIQATKKEVTPVELTEIGLLLSSD